MMLVSYDFELTRIIILIGTFIIGCWLTWYVTREHYLDIIDELDREYIKERKLRKNLERKLKKAA